MGYRRATERDFAIKLRLQGLSYNEIRKIVGVPSKGTISAWLKNLKLTATAKARLQNNMKKATERGLLKFNAERSARIDKENLESYHEGLKTFERFDAQDLLMLGVALYWGEGTKNISTRTLALSFTNSDPKMISCFLRFLREVLNVPEERIRAGMHLYDGTSDEIGRGYWAKITNLPEERFYIVRQVNRSSQRRRNPNLLPFGTAVIRVNDRKIFSKIKGMVDGLASAVQISV